MALNVYSTFGISEELLEAIRAFPLERKVEHCSVEFTASPLDIYAECPRCGTRLKLRSFSAAPEIEDIFDAVLEWSNRPGAQESARRRQIALGDDE
jgi:hypothetical protein